LLFTNYLVAFEFTAALMITAVFAAMVLAHREDLMPKRTQASNAKRRMADYAATGRHPGNPPTPGVFARSNAVDMPALLPDGSTVDESVSATLRARGQERSPHPAQTRDIAAEIDPKHELGGDDEGVLGADDASTQENDA
jgi:NADH-quinone oxidoreductase subunit J